MASISVSTALGNLLIEASETHITKLIFSDEPIEPNSNLLLQEGAKQVKAYFSGTLQRFDLPLFFNGTEFQKLVWETLLSIPFGATSSYAALSVQIGNPEAIRAVGMANGKNPLSIVVPCHRVIGSNGSLTGYAGGLFRKKWLLDHEAKFSGKPLQRELGF